MATAKDAMGLSFSVEWKPFFLDAKIPGGEGVDKLERYKAKFGAERVAQMMPHMTQTFRDEGILDFKMTGRVGNTHDSHRLLEHAMASGGPPMQDALVEALFDAYFCQGKPLSSRAVLLDAASRAQLGGAEAVLDGEDFSEEVWSSVEQAYAAGVSGVPYFKIDGGGAGKELSGGQPPEAFLQIFSRLAPQLAHGFAVGSAVMIQGLATKPEHNAKRATVLGAQGERVQVRLPDGVDLALRPANLEPASDGAATDCA